MSKKAKNLKPIAQTTMSFKTVSTVAIISKNEVLLFVLDSYDAVRAMMFLGFFFMLGTLACITVSTLVVPNNNLVDIATIGVSGMTGIVAYPQSDHRL